MRGTCLACGCARHECECADRASSAPAEIVKPQPQFEVHGSYIQDWGNFHIVRKLGREEAFDLLLGSSMIVTKPVSIHAFEPKPASRRDFLMNKCWAVVAIDREKGFIDVVCNHDGLYSLYRSGAQAFILRAHASAVWNPRLRSIYEQLTQPHEYA